MTKKYKSSLFLFIWKFDGTNFVIFHVSTNIPPFAQETDIKNSLVETQKTGFEVTTLGWVQSAVFVIVSLPDEGKEAEVHVADGAFVVGGEDELQPLFTGRILVQV